MSLSAVTSVATDDLFDGTQSLTLRDAALIYAALGWPILPVAPRGKQPLVMGGWKAATTDRDQILRWWDEHPQANIGYRPDGSVVIDSDSPDAPRGGLHLPPTAVAKSGRGHHYFYVANRPVRSRNGVRTGLDIKGPDGYVILPPSVHPDGTRYEWLISPECTVDAPDWIYLAVEQRPTRGSHAPGALILEGERETYLTEVFGAMRRHGLIADEMLGAGRVINQRFVPPLLDRDLKRVATSIARYAPSPDATVIDGGFTRAPAPARVRRASAKASARDTAEPTTRKQWRPESRWSREELARRLADAPTPLLAPRPDAELGRLANEYERITGQPISSANQWNLLAECCRIHGDDLLPFVEDLFEERRHANNLLGMVRTTAPRRATGTSR